MINQQYESGNLFFHFRHLRTSKNHFFFKFSNFLFGEISLVKKNIDFKEMDPKSLSLSLAFHLQLETMKGQIGSCTFVQVFFFVKLCCY